MINILLHIAFQSGEFYNEGNSFLSDFLINAFGALIGTLTALTIFWLTIKHDRKNKKANEVKVISQRLHYFSSIVNNITDIVTKQNVFLKDFFEKQRKDTLNIPLITLLPDNDLRRFSELQNHEDYYHAYLSKFSYSSETVEEYRCFYSYIDFLKAQIDQLRDRLMKSIQYDHDRKVKYKILVEKAMDDTARIVGTATISNRITEFEMFLNQSLLNFYSIENDHFDLNNYQSFFVEPVKIEIIKKYAKNEIALQLVSELKKATYIFSEITTLNYKISCDVENIYEKYNEVCSELEKLAMKLSNKLENTS